MSLCIGCMIKNGIKEIVGEPNQVNFKFPADGRYLLSLDQSTSCTGIYFTDTKVSFHLMLELRREGTPKEEFFRQLKYFLIRLTDGLDVVLFLTEDVPNTDDRYTKKVLRDLKKMIDKWGSDIPSLHKAEHSSVLPQVWKSAIVNSDNGKRRFSSKRAMAEDLCEKVPALKQYLDKYLGTGFDCFDAAGILHGYLLTRFDEDGMRKIMGTLTNNYVYEAYYIPLSDASRINNLIDSLVQLEDDIVYCKWNTDYGIRDNYRLAVSEHNITVVEITDARLKIRLLYEFDLPFEDAVICAIVRKSKVSTQVKQLLRLAGKKEIM